MACPLPYSQGSGYAWVRYAPYCVPLLRRATTIPHAGSLLHFNKLCGAPNTGSKKSKKKSKKHLEECK
jgi:hypothetical protein